MLHEFQCLDCSTRHQQLAGPDDATALCPSCGGLSLSLAEPLFAPLLREGQRLTDALAGFRERLRVVRPPEAPCP